MIEPLQKAFLMNILDASATSTRVPERVIGVTGVPADPAHVLLLLLLLFLIPRLHAPLQASRRQRRIRSRIRRRFHAAARNVAVLVIAVYARRRLRGDLHVWTCFWIFESSWLSEFRNGFPTRFWVFEQIKKASSSLKRKKEDREIGGFLFVFRFYPPVDCDIMTVLSLWVWINYRFLLPAYAYVGWRGRRWLVCCSVVRTSFFFFFWGEVLFELRMFMDKSGQFDKRVRVK